MRAQTPRYVVSVQLRLPETVENHLEKSFHIVNSAYNEALSFGLRRFEALKQNPTYQELLESRRELLQKPEKEQKTKNFKAQKKEIDKALTDSLVSKLNLCQGKDKNPEGLTLLRYRTRQTLFFLLCTKRI